MNLANAFSFDKVIFLIASIYLWLIFGFLSDTISCDMKLFLDNIFFRQIAAISSIFLLFALIDQSKHSAMFIWKNTLIVYILYLAIIKNKWYFSIPIFICMIIHQTINSEIVYLEKQAEEDNNKINNYKKYKNYLSYIIIALVVVGFIHYFIKQKQDKQSNFDYMKFLFSSKCKK